MSVSTFLTIDDVCKRYGSQQVLESISFDVVRGEFLTLLGPSGSGKSTLLAILAGFVQPDRGRVQLVGRDITYAPPEARRFGVVPQGYGLFPHLTVHENVAFPLRVRRSGGAQIDRRVGEVLELLRIGDLGRRLPKQLSGGQQQRVALARALAFEPDLLLLDEPMSALDALLRRDLQAELARLHRQVGTTFVHVTHDQQEALALSDRVAVLNQGRVEQTGTPRAIYDRPASRFVATFLGQNNLLDVTVGRRADGRGCFVWQGHQIVAGAAVSKGLLRSGDQLLAIRPEHISVERAAGLPLHGEIRGVVVDQVFHGSSVDVIVKVGDDTLTVTSAGVASLPERGEEVRLTFDVDRFWSLPRTERPLSAALVASAELAA